MKNRNSKNHFIFLLQIFLLLVGCMNTDSKNETRKETAVKTEGGQLEIFEENNDELLHANSMMKKAVSEKADRIEIDSFKELHSFDPKKFQFENCDEFTIKMLAELEIHGIRDGIKKTINYPKVTKAQNKLLEITEYLCDKTFKDNFGMYIFHSNSIESHSTNSIHLFTILNETNKFNQLLLSGQYMREGYEFDITSHFLTLNEVEVTKEERIRTSNISPKDDSVSITKINYLIDEKGEIIVIN